MKTEHTQRDQGTAGRVGQGIGSLDSSFGQAADPTRHPKTLPTPPSCLRGFFSPVLSLASIKEFYK